MTAICSDCVCASMRKAAMMWALQSIALAACKVFSLLLMDAGKESVGERIRSIDSKAAAMLGSGSRKSAQAKIATLVPSRSMGVRVWPDLKGPALVGFWGISFLWLPAYPSGVATKCVRNIPSVAVSTSPAQMAVRYLFAKEQTSSTWDSSGTFSPRSTRSVLNITPPEMFNSGKTYMSVSEVSPPARTSSISARFLSESPVEQL